MELITEFLSTITLNRALIGIGIFILSFSLSLAVVSFILIRIPPTYFREDHPRDLWTDRHAALRITGLVGKNILGALLIALGIVMSLPGVPGQGLLTILLGVMLVDFPGKRRLEYKLISRPSVLTAVNRLRQRFGRPALVLE